ncbi:uncharacterized protein LOC142329491 [Lycorma delicatula]|uniref:uncharacterized protein LOC142329491 n=1 Tax=Lycorma delicatula TaxID=130591 RepID=UPI003F512D2E
MILQKQQSMFAKLIKDNTAAIKSSYLISHLIATKSKPFTEGEFISESMFQAVEVLCQEKLKNVSLTKNAVASRTDDVAENLCNQLKSIILTFETYSIVTDKSTDVQDKAQLTVKY